jgi:hypothetical protein
MRATKTTDQLKKEIEYFAWLLRRTRSRDRIRRALSGIRWRRRELAARRQDGAQ